MFRNHIFAYLADTWLLILTQKLLEEDVAFFQGDKILSVSSRPIQNVYAGKLTKVVSLVKSRQNSTKCIQSP